MIDLERIEGIYLYQGITDMRRGIDSLAALASTSDGEEGHASQALRLLRKGQKDA